MTLKNFPMWSVWVKSTFLVEVAEGINVIKMCTSFYTSFARLADKEAYNSKIILKEMFPLLVDIYYQSHRHLV